MYLLRYINYLINCFSDLSASFPGLWEIAIEAQKGPDGTACSLYDDFPCWQQLNTTEDVYDYMKSNFDRHFANGTSPFPVFGHLHNLAGAANAFRKEGRILNTFFE